MQGTAVPSVATCTPIDKVRIYVVKKSSYIISLFIYLNGSLFLISLL